MGELVTNLPKPEIPLIWNYDESVKRTKTNYYKWSKMTLEMFAEIWIAFKKLSKEGRPKTVANATDKWSDYCQDCGVDRKTIWRWFVRLGWLNDGLYSSNSSEWYTPSEIIYKVCDVLGEIDLDPCSDSFDKPNIPAKNIFTKKDDALNKEWFGRVYMNPPYGNVIDKWTEKLSDEYDKERVQEAIALLPGRPDTVWFRGLNKHPRCFIFGRLIFSGQENSAPFPSMVVYMGNRLNEFINAFGDIGDIYMRINK